MSRYYQMEVEIDDDEWTEELQKKLEEAGVDVNDVLDHTLMGHTTLAGGETEEEAHARFEKILGRELNSRWLCLEYQEWDVIIENHCAARGYDEEE